jgi:putative glutamine amidotransferase|tara:strand:- start:896 stop:1495 length:600 start_codon:yes stop_codon:yes gene_type:complete
MNIGIVPTVRETYKDQYEFSIDIKLVKFLKKINNKTKITFLSDNSKLNFKYDLIIFAGGNDLIKFDKSQNNLIRKKLDDIFYLKAKREKIPMLGICYGATYFVNKFKNKIIKKKKIGNHNVIFKNNKFFKNKIKSTKVNSFKNFCIKKLDKNFEIIAQSNDDLIEAFFNSKFKFLGLMWHPERYKKFKQIDIKLVKNLL